MFNKIFRILKKVIFGFLFLYAYNSFMFSLGFNIPINVFTVAFVTILGFPGLVGLCFLSLFVF
ncbi:MAG: pro-sigmaK processing inhibitor BofA family protein [Bacilli bacterium]